LGAGIGLEISDAVFEELATGKGCDVADLAGNKDRGPAGGVGDGRFDERIHEVVFAATKGKAAPGNVGAFHDFLAFRGIADAGGERDAGANIAAAVSVSARQRKGRAGGGGRNCERYRGRG